MGCSVGYIVGVIGSQGKWRNVSGCWSVELPPGRGGDEEGEEQWRNEETKEEGEPLVHLEKNEKWKSSGQGMEVRMRKGRRQSNSGKKFYKFLE